MEVGSQAATRSCNDEQRILRLGHTVDGSEMNKEPPDMVLKPPCILWDIYWAHLGLALFPERSFDLIVGFYILVCRIFFINRIIIPSLPKSSKYLVSKCLGPLNLGPLKALSGGVCGSKHLLTRYLED